MEVVRDRAVGEEAALRLVQSHAAELLRFARRFSICADDAHDAYQRSVEILVRRMRTAPPDEPLPWLRTVLRHEALAVRRERERLVGRDEVDFDRHESHQQSDPAELAAGAERLGRVAEALQRLKPQEVTALVLRAEGLSYKEIGARQRWTYTKVNRCVSEGRRALLDRLDAIESGAECERWTGHLSALADGEASMRQRAELRPHLRVCPACRATLRGFHEAPAQVAALIPVAVLPVAAAGDPTTLVTHLTAAAHALAERATFAATRFQGALDALPGTKVAAVAASTAAIAGGGAAIERAVDAPPSRAAAVEQVVAASPEAGPGLLTVALPVSQVHGPAPEPKAEFAGEDEAAAPAEFSAEVVAATAGSALSAAAVSPPRPARARPPAQPEFAGP